jgi:UDP-N-acetylglucosamine 2-epimerase (non-hydrolysing)
MKVLTVLGTRPEIIKLSRTIALLDKFLTHVIVHTGQNYDYELNQIFFEDLGLRKPDYFLDVAEEGLGETIANIIKESDKIFDIEKPDALLVLGDTNSCLATIMAKRKKIPIFHMEAGNRCFDVRVPEEINRKLVDHISDINFPYSDHAKNNLLNEGLHPSTIIKTGSPMKEVLDFSKKSISNSKILSKLKIKKEEYFVASIHREENVDSPEKLNQIIKFLDEIASKYDFKVILSLHPRTKKKISKENIKLNKNILQYPPFGFNDYIHLQQNAYCVISDSGTIFEESSILSFPAITIREANERPEGVDEGTVIMCNGFDKNTILKSIEICVSQHKNIPPSIPSDYNVKQVSWKVLKSILSYKDYVNKKTWFKN